MRALVGGIEGYSTAPQFVAVEGLDLSIGAHPSLVSMLLEGDWSRARQVARELRAELDAAGYQPDGLAVKAGDSWRSHFEGASTG
jgi:hypothetical protein